MANYLLVSTLYYSIYFTSLSFRVGLLIVFEPRRLRKLVTEWVHKPPKSIRYMACMGTAIKRGRLLKECLMKYLHLRAVVELEQSFRRGGLVARLPRAAAAQTHQGDWLPVPLEERRACLPLRARRQASLVFLLIIT